MRWAWLLLLCACTAPVDHSRRPTEYEQEILDRAHRLWPTWFPSVGKECEANYLKFRVASYLTPEETTEACGNLGHVIACYIPDDHGFLGHQYNPTIVYTTGINDEFIFFHEYSHWASGCVTGDTDGDHSQDVVWREFVYNLGQKGEPK